MFYVLLIMVLVVFGCAEYIFLMPLNLSYSGTWIFAILVTGVLGGLAFLKMYEDEKYISSKARVLPLAPAIVMIVGFIVMLVVSLPIFRSDDYRRLIGSVQEKTFTSEIQVVDLTQLPVVKENYAKSLAEKKLGNLGSKVKIGEPTLQNNNGELRYVFPLLHRSFFKWASSPQGTPGYIVVSATNDKDVKLVDEINGQKIFIKYQTEAFFGDDVRRRLFFSGTGLATKGLTDFTFEIDNTGKPYWTTTVYEHTIGLSGSKAVGTAIMDTQTGEVKVYTVENTPDWVSRIQPQDIVENQVNSWGKYVHGWWNSFFSENDVLKTTEGYGIVFNNGRTYFYTGITGSGRDESTTGFMLVDTKTGQATYFKMSGGTEIAAEKSAESEIKNMGYKAAFPTLINVENIPTYFITLHDNEGLAKRFALVSVSNVGIVGVGRDVNEAKASYLKSLNTKGGVLGGAGEEKTLEAVVIRIGEYQSEASSYYAIILQGNENKLFNPPISLSPELPITKEGDTVRITFVDTGYGSINVKSFDNLVFNQDLAKVEQSVKMNQQKVEGEEKKENE
ncbi:hypothetical protein CPJCM30710_17870 [Clostridium polyendosporum]|uniref:Cell shape-determining protein n=1 Tax=Clostridium polyendosporum TaxID=69208 RepID=A0A919RZD1_9CLOT|nr:cell shape-determining protein [Clostridium polyendosporum]GIM29121.1 hypothetical protein CPJCM30710_17870 [Clostridium polyendosporum]